jgi:hypothetical protein
MGKTKGPIVHENGGIIFPVADPVIINEGFPDFSKPDDVQNYDIGTGLVYNGCAYFYGKAAGTVGPNMAVKPYGHQAVAFRSIQAVAAQYATSIYVTTTANDDDGSGSGIIVANALKGGKCVVYPAAGATYCFTRGITGNSALAAFGTLRLDLDTPIPFALTTGDSAEAMASPWAKVVLGTGCVISQQVQTGCGIPVVRATTGQWLWIQTWGLCWCSPAATLGNADNNQRGAWFQADGSLCSEDNNADAVVGQYAGWVASQDYQGGQGAPFVYLTIAHP